jgi:glucose-6-phosphate 1-dehydrogenase
MTSDRVDALVIFGATGDLAILETFPALVGLVERGILDAPVIGVAKSGWGLSQFRDYAASSLRLNHMDPDSPAAQKMLGLLRYVDGDLDDDATYAAMSEEIGTGTRTLFYLEVPPFLFGRIAQGISAVGRADGARVMVEKPFGNDLDSAQALNATMHRYFPEDAIYRVDHWLGMDPLNDVLVARFANSIIETAAQPRPRRQHPDHHGRGLRRRRPRPVLRQDRRHPRRGAEPHAPGPGHSARRPPRRVRPRLLAG